MTELTGGAAAAGPTPGTTLAAARKASGLTIEEVARQMRISPRQVAAIEADRYQELPGAVFVRGFVRNYARLLKIAPEPLLQALESELGADAPLRAHEIAGRMPERTRASRSRYGWMVVAAVVALTAAAAAYEWWRGEDSAPPPPAQALVSPQPAGESGAGSAPPQVLADTSTPRLADAPAVSESTLPRRENENGGSGASGAASTQLSRLEVAFAHDSWLELRDAGGQLLYSGTGAAGTVRSFEVQGAVEVVVGNVSGVRIAYNGQPFDLASHSNRNIARFTLP